jgi:hypothetical protein
VAEVENTPGSEEEAVPAAETAEADTSRQAVDALQEMEVIDVVGHLDDLPCTAEGNCAGRSSN